MFWKSKPKPKYRIIQKDSVFYAQVYDSISKKWKAIDVSRGGGYIIAWGDESEWEDNCVCDTQKEAEERIDLYKEQVVAYEFKILKEYYD